MAKVGHTFQEFFADSIAKCRAAFDDGGGFMRWVGMSPRTAHDEADQIPDQLRPHYRILLNSGQIVWGCVAQVNVGMFSPGPDDLPGVTVYSTDRYYDSNPQDLYAIARACFSFKDTEPVEEEFKLVARRMTDEFDSTARSPMPRRLTDGREAFMGSTVFHRARLPDGRLWGVLFPMVIAPQATEANMILPLPYWPQALRDGWPMMQTKLGKLRPTSTAVIVADSAEKRPVQSAAADWDTTRCPVLVTPAMAEAYGPLAQQMNLGYQPLLFIGIHDDGRRFADFVETYDQNEQISFLSNGIKVVIRRDQHDRLRGTIVDYKDTLLAKGVVIRLAGE